MATNGVFSRRALAAAIIAISQVPATTALSKLLEPISFHNWIGGAYSNDSTGQFSHCVVSAGYTEGTSLMLTIGLSGQVVVGFARTDWHLPIGQQVPGELNIDDRYSTPVIGVALRPQMVSVSFPAGAPIFDHLGGGRRMTITSPVGSAVFELEDTSEALGLVRRCVRKYQATVPPNPELEKWIAANPWFNQPQFPRQTAIATSIDAELTARGLDSRTPAYWQELDARLRQAGVNTNHPDPHLN